MDIALSSVRPPSVLKLLANDVRWKLLTLLIRSDYCVQDLVRLLEQPQNLVSYHLRRLRDQQIVTERRSTADARDVYYSLDVPTLRTLYLATGEALHPALGECEAPPPVEQQASRPPWRVLFLCTENSARSQMAEALMRDLSHGQVEAVSAGSHPTQVHPLALRVLEAGGLDTSSLRARSLDEFVGQSFDRIVTVCDRVREICPTFPGDPERIHWSFPDPAAAQGSDEVRLQAFEQISLQLATRLRLLLTLLAREDKKKDIMSA
jgi:protein-tyrosine-phosphatase/DNA-binding transcriptional ArsR family regulator